VFSIDALAGQVLYLALATMRIAGAFLILPVFTPEIVPALVRNSIFVSLGLIVFLLQPDIATAQLHPFAWAALFAKEAAFGLAIGFFFSIFLWALEAAGQIIDNQIGLGMAQIVDPLTGHQTSLTGSFLARLANFVFMFSGGLLLVVGVVLESYAVWPIMEAAPRLDQAGSALFSDELQRLMTTAVLFAAPALVILLTVDLALGLVNRYAQQLNVFALSLALKAWLATAVVLLLLGAILQSLIGDMRLRPDAVLEAIRALQSPD
jgi:type III secretion protein T